MKIAIVCPYHYKSAGGVQTHIRDCANELIRRGHDVTVISPASGTDSLDEAGHVTFGRSRKITFNKTQFDISIASGNELKKLKNFLAVQNFDVIHFHTIWTPLLSFQILRLSRSRNIATFHDTPPDNLAGSITRAVFYLLSHILIRQLHAVIAVSPAPATHLARVPGREINIIPPCTSLKMFRKAVIEERQGVGKKITLLFVGRLDDRKGIFILLQAYLKLLNDKLDVRLLIGGDGYLEPQVREFVQQRNLTDVELLGRIDETEKRRCYAVCDIFCSPALHGESFGIVLVEAMASGKPVVAAANRGYRHVLGDKADVCLVRPGDVDDLYNKLRRLVMDSNLRQELGQWGAEESKKYDCETVVPALLDVYSKALNFKR